MNPPAPAVPPGRTLLTACAVASLALALLHVGCLFGGEETARFFTAPRWILALIRERSPLIYPVCAALAALLTVFGLYAWSGAGRMRPLPALRAGLVAVGAIYTLRGLAILPQVLLALRRPGIFPWQAYLFSGFALGLGLAHLAGTTARWRTLAPRPR